MMTFFLLLSCFPVLLFNYWNIGNYSLYITLQIVFNLIVVITIKKGNNHFNLFLFFTLSLCILYFSPPLFENDYYRYFFEGNLFLKGINIYKHAPVEFFNKTDPVYIKNLGFPEVPSIYGPLAHLYHGLIIRLFNIHFAIFFLQIVNLFLFIKIYSLERKKKLLLFLLPFVFKEFINSIHLDFFSVFFLYLGVDNIFGNNKNLGFFNVFVSFLIKPTVAIILPFLFLYSYFNCRGRNNYKRRELALVLMPFLLLTFFILSWPSIPLFIKKWEWNGGVSIFFNTFNIELLNKLNIIIPLIITLFYFYKKKEKFHQKWNYTSLMDFIGSIFLLNLLLSNTINSWYLIWPILFFYKSNNRFAVIILSLIWPLAYAPWFETNTVNIYAIFFHSLAWLILINKVSENKISLALNKCLFNSLSPRIRKCFTRN